MPHKILVTLLAVLGAASGAARADGPGLDFSGKLFVDLTHLDQKTGDMGRTGRSGLGLDVKRVYLTAHADFDEVWSAQMTTDSKYIDGEGITRPFVKKAYLQGAFSRAAVLRIGSAGLPWIPMVESHYGLRYVENTLVDRLKFGNSADWGVHLGGDVGPRGRLNYAVSVVNGGGYKHTARSQSLDVGARIGFAPIAGLQIAVGGYSGKRGKDTAAAHLAHTARRTDLMLAWASQGLRVGGEYFRADNWNTVPGPLADRADGYSLWASQALGQDYVVFARHDRAELSQNLDPSAVDCYYNLGLQYTLNKAIRLAAVVKYDARKSTLATSMSGHVDEVRSTEIGVWGELKF